MTGLVYPFAGAPADGRMREVLAGLFWLRMPLPFPPGHINLYCLSEPDGTWSVIDCGIHDAVTQAHWQTLEGAELGGRPISRLLVSHWHADHAGLAGWLHHRHGARVLMSASEYLQCRGLERAPDAATLASAREFYLGCGLDAAGLGGILDNMATGTRRHGPMPSSSQGLVHGQDLMLGGRHWRIFLCGGHALDLVAAWCPAANVLFTSDQVLPLISSHVGVMVMDPHADMLGRFLNSLTAMRQVVPADVMVLPSHNLPFVGLHQRIDELIDHHRLRCDALIAACVTRPRSCAELLPFLFRRRFEGGLLALTVRETQAHVNYLLARGRLARGSGQDGVAVYRAV